MSDSLAIRPLGRPDGLASATDTQPESIEEHFHRLTSFNEPF